MEVKLNPLDVIIDDSKIIELSIIANMTPDENESGTYDLQANYDARPIRSSKGDNFLDLSVEIASNEAPTYDIKIVTRTMFVFPKETRDELIDAYLRTEGAVRALDFVRAYVRSATAAGVWGSFDLPGIPLQTTTK